MSNLYVLVSYVDFDLKVMVYNVFDKRPLLLYESTVAKMDLLNINNDIERDKIIGKLQREINNAKKIVRNNNPSLYVLFDPTDYYYVEKNFTFEFDNPHIVTQEDLTKVMNMAMYEENPKDGYKIVNFIPYVTIVDNKKSLQNVIGNEVNSLSISGELIMSDTQSYYALSQIITRLDVKVNSMFIGNNIIKTQLRLVNDSGFLEIGTRNMNFTFNVDGVIKQTTLAVGFERILNDLYTSLLEDYTPDISEQAVRFIMQYFPLSSYNVGVMAVDGVDLDTLIETTRTLLVSYFRHIFSELKKQEIEISSFELILHEYPIEEFITLLNEHLDIEFKQPNIVKNITTKKENIKTYYLIKMLASDSTQKIHRGEHG